MADETPQTPAQGSSASFPGKAAPQGGAAQQSSGGTSFAQREVARAKQAQQDREEAEKVRVEESARLSHEAREAYEKSDAAAAAKQVREAERLMRGPSPVEAWVDHEGNVQTPGHVPGDPTRGPSS